MERTLNKDKIILAYYVNIEGMPKDKQIKTIRTVREYIESMFREDDTVMCLVVPSDHTYVEWVNQLNITSEQFDKLAAIETEYVEKITELANKAEKKTWFAKFLG